VRFRLSERGAVPVLDAGWPRRRGSARSAAHSAALACAAVKRSIARSMAAAVWGGQGTRAVSILLIVDSDKATSRATAFWVNPCILRRAATAAAVCGLIGIVRRIVTHLHCYSRASHKIKHMKMMTHCLYINVPRLKILLRTFLTYFLTRCKSFYVQRNRILGADPNHYKAVAMPYILLTCMCALA